MKIQSQKQTSIVFSPGKFYLTADVLNLFKTVKSEKFYFDLTSQGTIPIVEIEEREETPEEIKAREKAEAKALKDKETREKNLYKTLKKKFEPKKEQDETEN